MVGASISAGVNQSCLRSQRRHHVFPIEHLLQARLQIGHPAPALQNRRGLPGLNLIACVAERLRAAPLIRRFHIQLAEHLSERLANSPANIAACQLCHTPA